jgi:uncharacterized protein with PQ loop repeat
VNPTALALVASAVFLVRLLPQPVRLARTGHAAGVSALAALTSVLTTLGWLAYGLWARLPVVWGVSVVALVPGIWTVVLLRRETTRMDVAAAGSWLGVQVVAALTGLFAAVLAAGVLVTQGPQVLKSLRESDLSGIAPATWWISLLDAATWGAYGVAIGDAALMGYGVVLSGSAVIVLGRIHWTRWQATRPALEPSLAESAT